jgi:N-succinyldiaminopimelate aminotransferase
MQEFGTTIFAEMSALATATSSINLGQGFPDTDGPRQLLDDARQAIADGQNQYPPGPGIIELRQAVATHQRRFYDIDLHPDHVLVTAGATEAIAATLLSLVEAGDEVVVFEPYYDSYAASIALANGRRKTVTLERHGQQWEFNRELFKRAITSKTRMILLNSPHNPTGKVFCRDELEFIAAVAIEHDLIVVSDEVYEHLVFEGQHVPICTLPGMAERTITISSAGKTFSVTGWKIGWLSGPAALVSAARTVKQFLTYVNGSPFQPAVARALAAPGMYFTAAAQRLQDQRDLLCDGLMALGYDVIRPQATYFATVDVGGDGIDFCRELPVRHGVVAIPSRVFYDSDAGTHYVRFAFCKRPDVLEAALVRLGKDRA